VIGESNDRLRAAREAVSLTQGQLAELANMQVERVTGRSGAMDADYIGKLERGIHRWPNRQYRAALCDVLRRASEDDLGFFSTRSRAATVTPRSLPDRGDDVERKAFLRVLAGSIAGMAFTDPLGALSAVAAPGGATRRIGQAEVDQVRHLARMFAGQDHVFGSGLSADAVVTQLSKSAQLLEGRFTTEATRTRLFSAVADLADVAGGMCFDAGGHGQAQRCFRFAVGAATEAGDWAMRAKALSGLANLAVHQGKPDDALSFAEIALVRRDCLSPVVHAVMHTRHARALGLSGSHRESDCLTATDRAQEAFAGRGGDEPDWIAYYGTAHLERDLGRALLHLALNGGDHRVAQTHLTTAVSRFPAAHSRGRTLAMANLAHLTMARDDPHHAATLGHAVVDAVGPIRSDRVFDALRQLRTAARPHRTIPTVRQLNGRLDKAFDVTRTTT